MKNLPLFVVLLISLPATAQVPCFVPTNSSITASGGPVTDSGTLHLHALQPVGFSPVLEGAHYILSGYRYNGAPPSAGQPEGAGKERIHRSCHRIGPPLPDNPSVYELTLGRDLPSGDYFLGVVQNCPADLSIEVCEATHNFLVAPSYMITTLDTLRVLSNSEEEGDHPAEMKLLFASYSGKPFITGQASTAKIALSGNYPDGPKGSGHLTQGDGTEIRPDLPVFVGRQSEMFSEECTEEAAAFPAGLADLAAARCVSDEAQGRFSDHYEFAVSAVEFDSDSADVWGKIAGAAAIGLSCYLEVKSGGSTSGGLGKCLTGAPTLAGKVSGFVEDALTDEDDNLGHVGLDFQLLPNLTFQLSGENGFGPADFVAGGNRLQGVFRAEETGGLMLLDYKVEVEEIEIIESYELFSRCEDPPEVYAIMRGYAFDGAGYPAGEKRPRNRDFFSLPITFDIPPIVVEDSIPAGSAVETPGVYIEVSVWESDGKERDGDLMGVVSATHRWQDLFSASKPDDSTLVQIRHFERRTPEGFPAREVQATYTVRNARGFAGSDNHCVNPQNPQDVALLIAQDKNAHQGHVALTYKITATWLQSVLR